MKKIFVLDTNVLLYNAQALESFADNIVVIPMTVVEEIDKFKRNQDELGRNARHAIRLLDSLRKKDVFRKESVSTTTRILRNAGNCASW